MKTWFARLLPPRPTFALDMTDAEKPLTDADPVIRANLGLRYEIFPIPMGAVHK